jgi:glycine betaine/proline transport system substrate-binding protein
VETPYLSGKYRALVIGNNDYDDPEKLWPSLETAVADAEAVANILKTDYGFAEITLLKNATRRDIVKAFNNLAKTAQDSDSVLIYYAGHGYLNEDTKEGFWIPVDAEGREDSTFVRNSTIKVKLGVIADKARHVLLVSDSCFSGALLREGNRGMSLDQKNERYFQKVAKKKSVQILAAGGLEFVDDNYKGTRHSPFTYYFLQSLKDNNARYFEATDLSQETSRNVSVNTVQTPESGVLQGAGHAGGEFFFLRNKTVEALSKMESKPDLPKKPSSGSFSLADLDAHAEEEESVRKAWQQKQGEMNAAVKQVRSYNQRNVSPSLKTEAWRRFIAAFSEDNPYSSEDENLRNEARDQIANWETQQGQLKAKKKRLAEAKRKAEVERKKQKKQVALRSKKADSRAPIVIPIHNWSSQVVMAYVIGGIFESMGNNVEYKSAGSQAVYESIRIGDVTISHEVWQSAFGRSFNNAIAKGGVIDAGTHAAFTLEEVGVPQWVIDKNLCPGLPYYKALKNCAKVFSTPDSGGKGRILDGPQSWHGSEYPDRVQALLGDDWVVKFAGSAGALWAELAATKREGRGTIFFNWSPNFTDREGFVFIEWPPYYPGCRKQDGGDSKCGSEIKLLKKAANSKFPKTHPKAYMAFSKMSFNTRDIGQMAALVDIDKMSHTKAARKWLADHKHVWKPFTQD